MNSSPWEDEWTPSLQFQLSLLFRWFLCKFFGGSIEIFSGPKNQELPDTKGTYTVLASSRLHTGCWYNIDADFYYNNRNKKGMMKILGNYYVVL
jgi:hypothetical protein